MKKLRLLLLTVALPAMMVCCYGYVMLGLNKATGFNRNIVPGFATLESTYKSSLPLINFAGSTEHNYYFRTTTPETIVSILKDFSDAQVYNFKLDSLAKVKRSFRLQLDSPKVYLFAGALTSIMTGTLSQEQFISHHQKGEPFFTDAIRVASNRFVIRSYDQTNHDMLLKIVDSNGTVLKTEQKVSILKNDEGLTTQGNLLYHRDHPDRLYFVYKLINSFLCFDTSLNLIYAGHTIDTISNPKLSLVKIKKGKNTTGKMSDPPRYTNYAAAIANNALYIYSKVKADNDEPEKCTIDVYSQWNGKYQFSFYLPGESKEINDLRVDGNTLTVIGRTGRQIIKYHLKERN